MKRFFLCCVFLLFCFSVSAAELRDWTGSNGKVIQGEFISFDPATEIVKLKLKDGRIQNVKISLFSKNDQEFLKNQEKGDDPFGSQESESIPDGQVIRVSMEVDEFGNGKVRLEKASELPKDDFKGKEIKLAALRKAKIRMSDDGITNMIFDFNEPDFANIWYFWDPSEVDSQKKMLMIRPVDRPDSQIHGMGLVGFYPKSLSFPLKVVCDVAQFKKEIFNSEVILDGKGQLFSCRVLSESGMNGPFTVQCRWGKSQNKEWDFSNILFRNRLSLDTPQEFSFRLSLPNKKIEDQFRFGIGKNLNLGKNDSIEFESIGIKRLEFSGRFAPKLGVFPKEDGGSVFIDSLNTNGIGEKAGLQKGDIVLSINGIKCKNLQFANDIFNNCSFDEPLTVKVERSGKQQEIVIFEK